MSEVESNSGNLTDYIATLRTLRFGNVAIDTLHKLRGTMSGLDDSMQAEGGVFENVAEHTAMAMVITDVLGGALGLDKEEQGSLNLAAWLHDSGKKTERMWQRAIEDAEQNGSVMIQGDKEDLQRKVVAIRDVGLMEEEENVLAGVPQRSNILMKQNVPPSANGHGNDTAAKIMWFADATLTGTEIVPIQKRFDDLEKDPINGTRNSAFSNGYKEQFGGTTLYEVQRKLGKEYITFFADKLNLNETDFYPWLKNKVHERIIMRKMPVLPTS